MPLTIAVSGLHGAGTTTVATALAEAFNLRYISAGIIFRQLAKEKGLSLSVFSKMAEEDPNIDQEIDDRTQHEAEKGDVVIDAYIAGWVTRRVANLAIYLRAPLEVRALRIAGRESRPFEEVLAETQIREESEQHRFREFYGIDVSDLRLFDLVLDTGHFNAVATIDICTTVVKAYLASSGTTTE
ncbi:MAG: AAA family ATPase [Candidatus Hermodarchaeota archaeon]|nr:AAA family ATPase [Candidatus Hermodarchaeota archaeon]